jgi:hypothetical protein
MRMRGCIWTRESVSPGQEDENTRVLSGEQSIYVEYMCMYVCMYVVGRVASPDLKVVRNMFGHAHEQGSRRTARPTLLQTAIMFVILLCTKKCSTSSQEKRRSEKGYGASARYAPHSHRCVISYGSPS